MKNEKANRALTALEVGVLSQAARKPAGQIKFNLVYYACFYVVTVLLLRDSKQFAQATSDG